VCCHVCCNVCYCVLQNVIRLGVHCVAVYVAECCSVLQCVLHELELPIAMGWLRLAVQCVAVCVAVYIAVYVAMCVAGAQANMCC